MKTIGMARKVDDLGRIVLPVETRRMLGIAAGDALEIAVDGASILLTKIETRCVFCATSDDLLPFKGKQICSSCATGLRAGEEPRPGPSGEPAGQGDDLQDSGEPRPF